MSSEPAPTVTHEARREATKAVVVILPVVVLLAAGLAIAGGSGGATVGGAAGGIGVFALCVALAFIVQWIAYVPAYLRQTETFYDLTGALTHIGIVVLAFLLTPNPDVRSIVLTAMVVLWAARLGTFLVTRIRKAGHDDRFDVIKPNAPRFLVAWTLQGLWIAMTQAAALAAITGTTRAPIDVVTIVGLVLWLAGFGMEVVADAQKRAFSADPANRGRFIGTGLWAWSRHPNYAGEILLWAGIALIALPVLSGLQLVTLVSPVFVALLLIKVSGVPMLEAKADKRWGGQPDYEAYKARTPVLIPRPPRG